MNKDLLSTESAADYIGVKKNTLEVWRVRGCGPVYKKIGGAVRYRISDLEAFLESCSRKSTSEVKKKTSN